MISNRTFYRRNLRRIDILKSASSARAGGGVTSPIAHLYWVANTQSNSSQFACNSSTGRNMERERKIIVGRCWRHQHHPPSVQSSPERWTQLLCFIVCPEWVDEWVAGMDQPEIIIIWLQCCVHCSFVLQQAHSFCPLLRFNILGGYPSIPVSSIWLLFNVIWDRRLVSSPNPELLRRRASLWADRILIILSNTVYPYPIWELAEMTSEEVVGGLGRRGWFNLNKLKVQLCKNGRRQRGSGEGWNEIPVVTVLPPASCGDYR